MCVCVYITGGYRSSLASGAGWGGSADTPLPAAATPRGAVSAAGGGAAGAGAAARIGRVQFDVAPSPALTPSWRSSSWAKGGAAVPGQGGKGEVKERSPELRPEGEGEGPPADEFDEVVSVCVCVCVCVCVTPCACLHACLCVRVHRAMVLCAYEHAYVCVWRSTNWGESKAGSGNVCVCVSLHSWLVSARLRSVSWNVTGMIMKSLGGPQGNTQLRLPLWEMKTSSRYDMTRTHTHTHAHALTHTRTHTHTYTDARACTRHRKLLCAWTYCEKVPESLYQSVCVGGCVGGWVCPQKRRADLVRRTRKDGSTMSLAATRKANELDKDVNAWEENRLLTSGVVRLKEVRAYTSAGAVVWSGRGCVCVLRAR